MKILLKFNCTIRNVFIYKPRTFIISNYSKIIDSQEQRRHSAYVIVLKNLDYRSFPLPKLIPKIQTRIVKYKRSKRNK